MTTAEIIALVVVGIVVLVLVVAVVAKLVLHLLKGPLEARIAARYEEGDVLMKDLTANSFGLESAGLGRVRGNGGLVLTTTHLHFFMFLPRKEILVPLDAITELSITKGHAGKVTVYDLLKVRFTADGKADSIAWYLADPRAWKERIEELRAARPAG